MLEDVVDTIPHAVCADLEADPEKSFAFLTQCILEIASEEKRSVQGHTEHRDKLDHPSLVFADHGMREEEDASHQSVGLYEDPVLRGPCPIGTEGMGHQYALRPPGVPIQLQ